MSSVYRLKDSDEGETQIVKAADRRKGMLLAAGLLGGLMLAATARAEEPVAPAQPGGRAETPRRIGVSVGVLLPEADTQFDNSAYLNVHWSSFNLSEALVLDTHLTFVSYDDADADNNPSTDLNIDSSLVLGLTARHHHKLESLRMEYYFQVGVGYMINTAEDSASEADNGIVIPIGVGINYEVVPQRVTLGLEYTHWITEVEMMDSTNNKVELDASIIALTVAIDF